MLEIDHWNQVVDKGHLERWPAPVHHQTILGETGNYADHDSQPIPIDRPSLQANQILGPELAFAQVSSTLDQDLGPPYLLCRLPIIDPVESDLKSLVNATNRPHRVGAVLDPNRCSGLEVDDVFGLYVEAKKTGEAVGTAESADPMPGAALSRRTRRQL